MPPEIQVFESQLRVRYAETDQMGVVYHSNYIVWFEVGRVEMLRRLGFTYRDMEKQDDIHIAVVTIRTKLTNVRESLLHFAYEIVRAGDNTVLAEGESVHLVVDAGFERIHLPKKYLIPFLKAAGKS